MSRIEVTARTVRVRLTWREKLGGLHGDLILARDSVIGAEIVDDPVSAVQGLRAPGLALPGRVKQGTWRRRAGSTYVSVRRGEPAVRLTLRGHRYAAVLVSTPEAADVVRALS